MNYMKINSNDIANGEGVCVSVFVSGCSHRCVGCFNPEAWDYEAGEKFTWDTIRQIMDAISQNGILRNLSILGGEPLDPQNRTSVAGLISEARKTYGDEIKIYLWTGYVYEDLLKDAVGDLGYILNNIDFLIDGPYIESLKDITLKLRGSSNQRIIQLKIDKK